MTFAPAILNPGVLTVYGTAELNPGIGTVTLQIGSTSPQIGTVSPANDSTLTAGGSASRANTSFTPLQSGTTDIDIVAQPAGFTTPSQAANPTNHGHGTTNQRFCFLVCHPVVICFGLSLHTDRAPHLK